MTRTDLENQLLALSEAERLRLLELLWESLSSSDVKARSELWVDESERRLDAMHSGRLPSVDVATVIQQLRDALRR